MSSVECPLCFKNFPFVSIQNHVNSCNGNNNNNNPEKQVKRKHEAMFTSEVKKKFAKKAPWPLFAKEQKVVNNCKQDASCSSNVVEDCDTISGPGEDIKAFLKLNKPLAEVSRPDNLEGYFGQAEVLGEGTALCKLLKNNTVPSMILWGPPGCGKTTLAHIIACRSKAQSKNATRFVKMSATNSGKADVQSVIKIAINEQKMFRRKTILFIDEIHRFNKLQQDTFLPHVENGTIILLGATTENPSFALNSAVLSRCRVVVLKKLQADDIEMMLERAVRQHLSFCSIVPSTCTANVCEKVPEGKSSARVDIQLEALQMLSMLCDGDARIALNGLQVAVQSILANQDHSSSRQLCLTSDHIKSSLQKSHLLYDKTGDEHYNIMSALHKSVRGCDENAALYWLTRMMLGGEDPKVIARRLIRMASEDIGLADPNALNIAVSTYHSCLYVGMPECDVVLAECTVYLARAAKSVEVYKALEKAKACIKNHEGPLPSVPLHLRNAPTKLMKDLGCGAGYDYTARKGEQTFLPDELLDLNFFRP